MSIFSFGGPQYDVDDVKIAVNNQDGTFGTLVDVPSVDMYVTNFRMKSAEGRGDGRITAVASQIEAAEVTIRNLSINLEDMEIFFGVSMEESGSQPNRVRGMRIGNIKFPYFGVVGRAFAGETSGGTMVFVPFIKIMESFEWRMEYNTFVAPEITGLALGDPALLDADSRALIVHIKEYETLPAVAMPLPHVAS